jgi:hypothetical protein
MLCRAMLSECAAGPLSSIALQSTAGKRDAQIRQGSAARDQCTDGGGKGSEVSPCGLGQDHLI